MRNSVKVVIDAYDGTVTRTWRTRPIRWSRPGPRCSRAIFRRSTACRPTCARTCAIPERPLPAADGAVRHLPHGRARAPSTTARTSGRSRWSREPERVGCRSCATSSCGCRARPRPEFIYMVPFTPRGKDNLAAWMVARNDGDALRQAASSTGFRSRASCSGRQQIENRINQDTEISRQISLWDQRGSEVIRGDLLVIPDRGVAALRAAALPARRGRAHSGAQARRRGVPEPGGDGRDPRTGRSTCCSAARRPPRDRQRTPPPGKPVPPAPLSRLRAPPTPACSCRRSNTMTVPWPRSVPATGRDTAGRSTSSGSCFSGCGRGK